MREVAVGTFTVFGNANRRVDGFLIKNFLIVLCFSFIMLSIGTDSVMGTSSKVYLNSHDTGHKNFDPQQSPQVKYEKSVTAEVKELHEYAGTWVIHNLNCTQENKPSGVIHTVTITVDSDTSGLISVGNLRIVDGYSDKSAFVESKFHIDDKGMARLDFEDDTYGHRGNVSIQFTDKGLVVECYSDNPEFVNEDGTVTRFPAGNWSLWEGELEFTWSTRNTGLCDTKFQAP